MKGSLDWVRELADYGRELRVETVQVELTGCQPNLRLELVVGMTSIVPPQAKFDREVDAVNRSRWNNHQSSNPRRERIHRGRTGSKKVAVEVDLPGLIPGDYTLQVWIGTLGVETLDQVRNCGEFTVHDSPTLGRTQPHMVRYGVLRPSIDSTSSGGLK